MLSYNTMRCPQWFLTGRRRAAVKVTESTVNGGGGPGPPPFGAPLPGRLPFLHGYVPALQHLRSSAGIPTAAHGRTMETGPEKRMAANWNTEHR